MTADEATRLSPLQRMTIDRLRDGLAGKVPVTIFAEARADALLAARAARGVKVTPMLAQLLARTLVDHPALNAELVDDETLVRHADVNLGIAVAIEDGSLVVPVIARAHERGLAELGAEIDRLAAAARAGTLALADVRGGTFTLSSVGMVRLPVLGTPLLVQGQSGILLAGSAAPRPVVKDGEIVAGHLLPLSLTFDHTVVNGVPALRFLEDLTHRIEHVPEWLE